jgi:hypothetical protein
LLGADLGIFALSNRVSHEKGGNRCGSPLNPVGYLPGGIQDDRDINIPTDP